MKYKNSHTDQTNTCSKSTIETLEQGGRYVQQQNNIRTTSFNSIWFLYCKYFTRYSSASIVVSEQVNVWLEPVLWNSIYPRAERRHRSTVFFVIFEHNSHHFLVFLWLTLNTKIFIGRASSDYYNIYIMHYKLLNRFFFQSIKRCCEAHVQAKKIRIGISRKEAFLCYF